LLKTFFFWGRNKNKKTLIERLGVKPRKFIDARFGKLEGKLADYSNLSDEEFIVVLGKLASIEWCYYTLNKIRVRTSENKGCQAWVYVEMPYNLITKRLDDMCHKGSTYVNSYR